MCFDFDYKFMTCYLEPCAKGSQMVPIPCSKLIYGVSHNLEVGTDCTLTTPNTQFAIAVAPVPKELSRGLVT